MLPRHQLARRGLSGPRGTRLPEYLALLPGLGCDVGTPNKMVSRELTGGCIDIPKGLHIASVGAAANILTFGKWAEFPNK